jgi:hypothetical protein
MLAALQRNATKNKKKKKAYYAAAQQKKIEEEGSLHCKRKRKEEGLPL